MFAAERKTIVKPNMKGLLGIVLALMYFSCCEGQQCSCNRYEEQILANSLKGVRLARRLELLEQKVNKGDKDCSNCPDGWIQYKGSCYIIVENKLSYDAARSNCQKLHGDLVHIENKDENTFLKNHLRTLKGIDFWIGLKDVEKEGVYKWVDDNSRPSFTDWYRAQPSKGSEHCVHFKSVLESSME